MTLYSEILLDKGQSYKDLTKVNVIGQIDIFQTYVEMRPRSKNKLLVSHKKIRSNWHCYVLLLWVQLMPLNALLRRLRLHNFEICDTLSHEFRDFIARTFFNRNWHQIKLHSMEHSDHSTIRCQWCDTCIGLFTKNTSNASTICR